MMTKTNLFLIGAMVFFVSCSKDTEPTATGTNGTDVILPLKVGNQWIYQLTYSDTTRPSYDTIAVTRDTLIGTEQWFLVRDLRFFSFGVGPRETWWTNRSTGLWGRDSGVSWLEWKFPASVGDSYLRPDGDTVRILATNVPISVPAGRFPSYQYGIYRGFRSDYFLCPHVGYPTFGEFAVTDSTGPGIIRFVRVELSRAILN
ncbi:MAG: hypothetical protein KF749_01545 [Bacteroidetes bacterium]|nr:hypothetical protein [Bacteroidota bacterium]MCW5896198.1 hypothetical protein [Bacteroidota bacterium]